MMENAYLQPAKMTEYLDFYKHENKSRRILIIDDDIEFRLILSELLVGQGYSISTAKGAKAAIANLSIMEELPQLILLDSHMAEGNGKEFIKLQKKLKSLARIPVILISGDIMAKEEFRKEKLAGFLTKPLDILEVIDVVQKRLSLA